MLMFSNTVEIDIYSQGENEESSDLVKQRRQSELFCNTKSQAEQDKPHSEVPQTWCVLDNKYVRIIHVPCYSVACLILRIAHLNGIQYQAWSHQSTANLCTWISQISKNPCIRHKMGHCISMHNILTRTT